MTFAPTFCASEAPPDRCVINIITLFSKEGSRNQYNADFVFKSLIFWSQLKVAKAKMCILILQSLFFSQSAFGPCEYKQALSSSPSSSHMRHDLHPLLYPQRSC